MQSDSIALRANQDATASQPVIPTDRLVLRPLRASDKGLLEHYAGDARVASMTTSIPHPLPPGAAEAFIERSLSETRREDVWALDGTRSGLGELVGVMGLERMEGTPEQSEIGYWIAPAFWNTGLASEALAALLAANPHRSGTIFASVFQDNPISARVLTNAGFEYLGDAEAFSVARGANVPTWTYLRKQP
ncbi:MAG: GNAT family N-acetyltransferase [Pseudomonadota bacterium]